MCLPPVARKLCELRFCLTPFLLFLQGSVLNTNLLNNEWLPVFASKFLEGRGCLADPFSLCPAETLLLNGQ